MRVVFYEPTSTGHHFAYLSRMLPGFFELPIECILTTTPESLASEEYSLLLKPLGDRLQVEAACTTPRSRHPVRIAAHRLGELSRLCQHMRMDRLIILYGDGIWPLATASSMAGRKLFSDGLPVEVSLYRGAFSYPGAAGMGAHVRRWLFRRLLRSPLFDRIHLNDDLLYDYAFKTCASRDMDRVFLAADPIEMFPPVSRQKARQQVGLPEDGRFIVGIAMINRAKGMHLVIDAFAEMVHSGRFASDRLVLAGPHAANIQDMLGSGRLAELVGQGKIISCDRYLTEREMYLFAAAGDVNVAAYLGHSGRSSKILWAAAAGRPCVGTAEGCVGYMIRTYGLGWTVDLTQPEDLRQQLESALSSPWTLEDERRVRSYAESHRVEAARQTATAGVRRQLEARGSLSVLPS